MTTRLRQRLLTVFTVIGIVTTVLALLVGAAITCTCASREEVPRRTVLELHLDRPLGTPGSSNPLDSVLGGPSTSWVEVVEALERASTDDRVLGVVAYLDGTSHGMAQVEELRDAIIAFRASGKPAVAFSETLGEMGPGNQGYYLATAFDEIWLQPTGAVGLTGLRSEQMFMRGTFDKLDIEVQGDRRAQYKTAYDRQVERHMSEASREQTEALLGDMRDRMVEAIAPRLRDDADRARTVMEQGPYLASEALELGLVDGLAYRDEVLAKLEQKVGGDAERLYPKPYLERAGGAWDEGTAIAVIHGSGPISRGPSSFDPLDSSPTMGAETVVAAFGAAIEDPEVEAIVFRVDSPGGSAVASDAIWRATARARDAGKPVVVSMGNYAASGGYYVSAGANKIVAHPSTITGSIGVVAIKMVTRGLWNKLGITWDTAQTSGNAAFWSDIDGYDTKGWADLQLWLDRIYTDFKQRVVDGRGLTPEQVEAVAKGRVWTGTRAKELGLVDELGGLSTAIALAKQEAGLSADAAIELRMFPASKSMVTRLLEGSPDNSDDISARAQLETGLERWRGLAAAVRAAELASGEGGVVMAPPLVVE
ncbi:signal peptide peptidase SppA [Paraliomyxa miuraensis]|uniref:signal peptide peptidase SppA n=1 Tax=Paraliomyxa miuraensis TaxID=376150 RepID=UPI002252EB48|nr:signal peptide peptidase SppA [Paraliomyxa miuraensis]MCX4246143.1 signal peptide peptidase SppA [Paraliomyxa miuraensis]